MRFEALKNLLVATLTLISCTSMHAQLLCPDSLTVAFDTMSMGAQLSPEFFIQNESYEDATVTPEFIDCTQGETYIPVFVTATINGVPSSCNIWVKMEDQFPPMIDTKDTVVITLIDGFPTQRVFPQDVDGGSEDIGCTASEDLRFEPEFVTVDCSNIGVTTIYFDVYDQSGNSSILAARITVEDTTNPPSAFICPQDTIVDCSSNFYDENAFAEFAGISNLDLVCEPVEEMITFAPDYNGNGELDDAIIFQGEVFYETHPENVCSGGLVRRQWVRDSQSDTCTQYIFVRPPNQNLDTEIDWPYSLNRVASLGDNDGQNCIEPLGFQLIPNNDNPTSVSIELNCLEGICEEPILPMQCSTAKLQSTMTSDTMFFEAQACAMIVNTYTVLDWCSQVVRNWTVSGSYVDQIPPRLEVLSGTALGDCSPGGKQLILRAKDQVFDVAGNIIDGECMQSELSWSVSIDWFSDANIDEERNFNLADGENFIFEIPNGFETSAGETHQVFVTINDICSNTINQTLSFTVDGGTPDMSAPLSFCKDQYSTHIVETGDNMYSLQVIAKDMVESAIDNCTADEFLRYTFSATLPENDASFDPVLRSSVFTSSFALEEFSFPNALTVYVWDQSDNFVTCNVPIHVENGSACFFEAESAIIWPQDLDIDVANVGVDKTFICLSPDALVLTFGIDSDFARIAFNTQLCNNFEIEFNDQVVFVEEDNYYKIFRNWSVVLLSTLQKFEHTQIIRATLPGSFICDTQPNNTDVTDCEGGHSDTDDVEWPADIQINDHRLQPDALVQLSEIPFEDSRPIFFNEPDMYEFDYIDIIDSLSEDFASVFRTWVVSRKDTSLYWLYGQNIGVDKVGLENSVVVFTHTRRYIPGVTVGPELTDQFGTAILEEDDFELSFNDSPYNGVTVRDLKYCYYHTNAMSAAPEYIELTGDNLESIDVNRDGTLFTTDYDEFIFGWYNGLLMISGPFKKEPILLIQI